MMRQYELIELVAAHNKEPDEALLNRAYVYSMQKHGHQTRASGDPYFSHPLEVAAILTRMNLDNATIATALLHDTIEDTDATRAEIDQLFGEEIGKLVDGLTKISRLDLVSHQDKQAENFRKLLLAVADDVRVLLVKLADRLHNMRTLNWVPQDKRRRIAEETMDVYAPLAGKMGIHWMREELEHLAFQVLKPEDAAIIEKRLEEMRVSAGDLFRNIEDDLSQKLEEHGIKAKVQGREKRPFSIYNKMQRKAISFEQLSDLYGFRVLVSSIPECYEALGVIHTIWSYVPGRFKDHISNPKQNDYRSLHTTVVGPREQRVELQIRTHEMHKVAEYGIAAHAFYKDGAPRSLGRLSSDSSAYAWLRQTIELLSEGNSPQEFFEHTKLELFQDQVFCFTPRGKLIALPRGATPIDFAYAVHTDVGNTCTGCKINGHTKALMTPLVNGDEVEIVCDASQSPPSAWRSLAVTGKAKAAIRRASREHDRRNYVRLGRHMIGNEIALGAGPDMSDLNRIAPRLGLPDGEAVAHAVGECTLSVAEVLDALGIGEPGVREAPTGEPAPDTGEPTEGAPIFGVGASVPVRFSARHKAIPGDPIVGIINPDSGVTIYPASAGDALSAFASEPQRWLPVSWDLDGTKGALFPVGLRVVVANECGALAEIATAIANRGSNIDDLTMARKGEARREMIIQMEVRDRGHLDAILDAVRALSCVSEAERVTPTR